MMISSRMPPELTRFRRLQPPIDSMSFLEQLRQKQSSAEQRLSLNYCLSIQAPTNTVKLQLKLTSSPHARSPDEGKTYRIQQQHLQQAPPFLLPLDIALLRKLVDDSCNWLQQESGYLSATNAKECIPMLLETKRCFINLSPNQWQRLSPGKPVQLYLKWVPDQSGKAHLKWGTDTACRLLFLDHHTGLPVAWCRKEGSLSLAEHGLSTAALNLLSQSKQHLPVNEIEAFVHNNQHSWTPVELPLPEIPKVVARASELQPTLHFFSSSDFSGSDLQKDCVSLRFRYISESWCSDTSFSSAHSTLDYWDGIQLNRLTKDKQAENKFYQCLLPLIQNLTATDEVGIWLSDHSPHWKELLTETREQLEKLGFHFHFETGFSQHYVTAEQWQIEIIPNENSSLQVKLSLKLDDGDINLLDLLHQLGKFNHKQRNDQYTLHLADQRLLLLPAKEVDGIMHELGDLIASRGQVLHLPASQISRLDGLQQQLPESTQWLGDTQHLDMAHNLHQTPTLLIQPIRDVETELRHYQWTGVCWLQHLKQHRVNGLLADDMGLGKTLQTLVHLNLERQQGELHSPALIIVPSSLMHNWRLESQKFTPKLRCLIFHGSKRHQQWESLQDYDILITSYSLIVNDLKHWLQHHLSWVILDEAQQIKNHLSQASQAIRQLSSDYRLCLTGTPVQNHLGELWSLMEFLMPGILGGITDFKRYFQKPIEQEASDARMQLLQTRIAPFLLRRTKEQVADDLPEKTEIYQYIDLKEEQRAFYDEQKQSIKSDMQQQFCDTEQSGQQQILLLTALLKLRQTCCDPGLLGATDIGSAKREHCIEMIEELVEEKRAILVFSQFTSMLELLAHDLDELNINYLKLTGKSRNRQQLVESFQDGEVAVFLISLKAGGVGFNLTRADTVIHFDPWWNIAAEQQASDRVHRIGQQKPVFIYKLIATNTIEEKIATLQQHKAKFSHNINHQAQISGNQFSMKLEDLMSLWQEETKNA
ncbi:MAG: DEAD/DEAH box helicase [Gammaproteobacteria bacterium]|nr:DEAD/DEAH box helicase [Gammaproteobacteria bacterium]